MINDWENIIAYCKWSIISSNHIVTISYCKYSISNKSKCWQASATCSKTAGSLEKKRVIFFSFYPQMGLEPVFPALNLTPNCYTNVKMFLIENWQFNQKLFPFSYTHSSNIQESQFSTPLSIGKRYVQKILPTSRPKLIIYIECHFFICGACLLVFTIRFTSLLKNVIVNNCNSEFLLFVV